MPKRNQKSGFLFNTNENWETVLQTLPNPKPSKSDRDGFGKLASLYTSFSVEFCQHLLTYISDIGCKNVCDPFAGMGSLGEAARQLELNVYLNDRNPFAPIANAIRVSKKSQIEAGLALVEESLEANCLNGDEYRNVALSILNTNGIRPSEILSRTTLNKERHVLVAIFILCAARINFYKKRRGTNPTWTKKLMVSEAESSRFKESLQITLKQVREYSKSIDSLDKRFKAHLSFQDALRIKCPTKLDAIVTSPPYPNRTDYYKSYLAASELILSLLGMDERLIRQEQVGTPLIRPNTNRVSLTLQIDKLISTIHDHESYASKSYYWKGYQYYFSDMSEFFQNSYAQLTDGGYLVFVVQDAIYRISIFQWLSC